MSDTPNLPPLVVYVDVDDTLIRTSGRKRIPIDTAIAHVRQLHADGAQLFCWSSGGAEYAREVAESLGLAPMFTAFLPKPQVMLDDQPFGEWRRLIDVHPMRCESASEASYRDALADGRKSV